MNDDVSRETRIAAAAQRLPGIAKNFTQVVVDNPGQFAMVAAGTIVLTRAAVNLVRPRGPLEALALMVFLQLAIPRAAMAAVDRGWITFRVRTPDGRLVPLVPAHEEVADDGVVPARL
jgi:hypothetical protein